MKKKYNNVISLGFFCSVAMEMDRIHRRKASYPFDWCISSFPSVLNLIDNHFTDFLNYDQMEQNKEIPWHYRNAYGIAFYHDFNQFEPLNKQLPAVIKKYDRRIKRFYNTIKRPTLFIRYIENEEEISFIQQNLSYINSILKGPNAKNEILFVLNQEYKAEILGDVKCYYVEKDKDDSVARKFLENNKELEDYIIESVPKVSKNVLYYLKRYKKKLSTYLRIIMNKVSNEQVNREVYTHYKHY